MQPLTLNELFFSVVERNLSRLVLWKREQEWVPGSAAEFYAQVAATANGLQRWGITRGDRVAILSENRREWTVADFASLLIGAVVVPLYSTLTAEQIAFMLRDSGARAIFLSNEKHLQKISSIREQTELEQIILMDPSRQVPSMAEFMAASPGVRDESLERLARSITQDDLATMIYTSGTTGIPKGVMLTHGNMASNLAYSLHGFDLTPGDVSISYLPLSHITARHLDFAMLNLGVTIAYLPVIENLPQALSEVHPTIFVGVPRLYEKVHGQVELKASGFKKKMIYNWSLQVGQLTMALCCQAESPAQCLGRLPTVWSMRKFAPEWAERYASSYQAALLSA